MSWPLPMHLFKQNCLKAIKKQMSKIDNLVQFNTIHNLIQMPHCKFQLKEQNVYNNNKNKCL